MPASGRRRARAAGRPRARWRRSRRRHSRRARRSAVPAATAARIASTASAMSPSSERVVARQGSVEKRAGVDRIGIPPPREHRGDRVAETELPGQHAHPIRRTRADRPGRVLHPENEGTGQIGRRSFSCITATIDVRCVLRGGPSFFAWQRDAEVGQQHDDADEDDEPGEDQALVPALTDRVHNARPSRISTAATSPPPITKTGARVSSRCQWGVDASTVRTVA